MTIANNPENNLSPWKPGQSGNPSGRPKGTRDLAGYVLETTDGGKELVDALVCIARGVTPNIAVQEGSRPRKDQQVRPADLFVSRPDTPRESMSQISGYRLYGVISPTAPRTSIPTKNRHLRSEIF